MAKKQKKKPIELIEEEYMIHNEGEDDEMYLLKEAVKNALNPIERKIFLTYVETGTYAEVAKTFKVTAPTVAKYIKALITKITDYVSTNI